MLLPQRAATSGLEGSGTDDEKGACIEMELTATRESARQSPGVNEVRDGVIPWSQLLVLTVLGLAIGGYFFAGLYGSDDLQYVAGAYGLGGQVPDYATIGGGRYTITAPLRFFLIASSGDLQIAVLGFTLMYIAGACVVCCLVSRVASKSTALLSGILVVSNPLLFIYSGAVLPDNVLAILYACAALVLARWGVGYDTRLVRFGLLVLVGGAAGLSYITKEASVVFMLPLCVYAAYFSIRRGGGAEFVMTVSFGLLGFGLVLLGDMALSSYTFGHPFARLAYASELNLVDGVRKFMDRQGTYPWERLSTVWDQFWTTWPAVVLYLVGAGYLVAVRGSLVNFFRSVDGVIAVSAAWTFAYLTWGSVSLREYIGVPLQERYFAPCAVLLCVLFARALVELYERHFSGRTRLACITVVLLVGWQVLWPLDRAGDIYRAAEHRELRTAVASQRLLSPEVPIFVDHYFNMRGARYGHLPIKGSLASGRPEESRFIYIFNERERPRSAAEKAVLTCMESGAQDVSTEGRPPRYRTRLDAIKAGLGFHDRVDPTASRVRVIFVENMGRCVSAPK